LDGENKVKQDEQDNGEWEGLVNKHNHHHHHLDDEPVSKRTRSHHNVESQFHGFSAGNCHEECKTKCNDFLHQIKFMLG
jgi:hypothetical protein